MVWQKQQKVSQLWQEAEDLQRRQGQEPLGMNELPVGRRVDKNMQICVFQSTEISRMYEILESMYTEIVNLVRSPETWKRYMPIFWTSMTRAREAEVHNHRLHDLAKSMVQRYRNQRSDALIENINRMQKLVAVKTGVAENKYRPYVQSIDAQSDDNVLYCHRNEMRDTLRKAEELASRAIPSTSTVQTSETEGDSMAEASSSASSAHQPVELPETVGPEPVLVQLMEQTQRDKVNRGLANLRGLGQIVTQKPASASQAGGVTPVPVVERGTDAVEFRSEPPRAGRREGRGRNGAHGVQVRMGSDLFAETLTSVKADIDMIQTESGRVNLGDLIDLEREPAEPQRLASVCYTPGGPMYIRPVVNHYQRTLEECAEDPASTINAHEQSGKTWQAY